jgi:hypothetical protein
MKKEKIKENPEEAVKEEIIFSNTRLSTFRRCRLKYHWQYVEKQESKKATALVRGSAAHEAMAAFYSGKSIKEAVAQAWVSYEPNSPKSLERMLELDLILTRYFKWAERNDFWQVLAVEENVEVSYGSHKLMGIWDLLVKKDGRLFIVDHKFQKSHSFSHLEVDTQVSHYLALAKLKGLNVAGLILNIINLETGNTEKIALRQTASRADYFVTNYLQSLDPQISEIKQAQESNLPIYPNWTKDCCWDCAWYKKCIETSFVSEGIGISK